MASEDQEILAKISQLAGEFATNTVHSWTMVANIWFPAGQINRHKSGQPGDQQAHPTPASTASTRGSMESLGRSNTQTADRHEDPHVSTGWRPSRGTYPSRGYGRGARAQVHRNRTLVLNGNTTPTIPISAGPGGETPDSPSMQGWVSKTDRHLQLINTSIYAKETQTRAKAMEETRKQKLRQRDEREKAKFNKHLQRMGGNVDNDAGAQPRSAHPHGNYEISVQGIRFRVTKNGSKLVKVPGETYNLQTPADGCHLYI